MTHRALLSIQGMLQRVWRRVPAATAICLARLGGGRAARSGEHRVARGAAPSA
jgi:hypothetical protein